MDLLIKSFILCDNRPHTVTFIKVKGTGEIIGEYNPLIWKSPHKVKEVTRLKDQFGEKIHINKERTVQRFMENGMNYQNNQEQHLHINHLEVT
ncbi:hypothetical protein C1645_832027 [Glomus cerebriforme]|uniref:Uncharacterized protein n=1 Tax=Glomus cerebriforme TaxID=658196 RepID=A0A397SGE2_9GLOM|nr:hypothetical protein C1645_832027 [Glomus cerebriforme]